jgi:membrane protease YdiL (CAAX protease family)
MITFLGIIGISFGLEIILYLRSGRFSIWDPALFSLSCLILGTNYSININFLFQQGGQSIPLYIVWIIIFIWLYVRKSGLLNETINWMNNVFEGLLWGMLFGVLAIIVFNPYHSQPIIDKSLVNPFFWVSLTFGVVQKAVSEEIIFRLLLLNYLRKGGWNETVIIFIQGFLFGLIHIEKYQIFMPGLAFTFIFGWFAGWLATKQKNVWGVSITHVVINLISIFPALVASI